jgi:hypothetical protein
MASHPPAYEDVTASQPDDHLAGTERYTLVLDDCTVFPSHSPSRKLYEISHPPCSACSSVYGVQKVRYRLSDHDGEGRLTWRLDHIYDFQNKDFFPIKDVRAPVKLQGKTSRKRTYREVLLSRGVAGWSTCSVEGHFKAGIPLSKRLRIDADIIWKTADDVIVAIESRVRRNEDGRVAVKPTLEVREVLEEKDLDLLVSCWAARLWKEAEGDLKEPLTWQDCWYFELLCFRMDVFANGRL